MEQDAQQRILEYFIEEASDHLHTMEQGLMELQNSDDPADVLRELFRGAHSVKGGAAMLGLQAILSISHQLEDYFKILQDRQLHIDQELESYLLQGLDILKVMFYALPTVDPIINEQCLADMVPLGQKIEAKLNNLSVGPLEEVVTPEPLCVETVQTVQKVATTLVHTPLNPDEQKILGYFIEEAQENLAIAERNLAALCTPDADPDLDLDELREELYRSFHSIKGGAAMLHLQAIRQIAFRMEHFCREVHKQPDLLDSVLNDCLGLGRLLLEGIVNRLPEVNLELDEAALQAADPLMIRIENMLNRIETVDAVLAPPEVVSAMEGMSQEEPELMVTEWLAALPTLEASETETEAETLEVASAVEAMAQAQPQIIEAVPAVEEIAQAQPEIVADVADPAAIPTDLLEQIDEGICALQECFIQPWFGPVREEILTLTQTLTELGTTYGFPGFGRICQTLAVALLRSGDEHWQEMGFRVLAEFQQAKALILQGDGAKIKPSSWLMECAGLQVEEELPEPEVFAEERPSELFEPVIATAITEEVSELESLEDQSVTTLEDTFGDILAQLFAPPQADFIAAQVQAPVMELQTQQETIESLSSIFPEEEAKPIAAIETSLESNPESLEDLITVMPEVGRERPISTPASKELAASIASEADMDKAPPAAPPTARPERTESMSERNGRKIARHAAAASSEPRAPLTGPVVRRTMRVEVRHLDGLSNLVGELVINRNTLENQQTRLRSSLEMLQQRVSKMHRVSRELEEYYDQSVLGIQVPGTASSATDAINRGKEAFDALEMDRYTAFHTISQEIMELIVRIKEASSDIEFVVDESDETSRQFRQISSQLQEGLNQIRMLPLSGLVDRLPRAVRDLSINMGKEVELELLGRETLLDKAILEELYDPLTHLTTNALMHGIEPIEERRRLNKKVKGKITVSASHQGNQTIIAVKDDGRGLDAHRIRAKAVERGLLTPEQAVVMTDSEVFPLIFLPGFSTVEQVTEIAGRGVGMDVVQSRLNRLRGNVLIDSTPGEGTTFTIRLPLTLSISRAILCRHGQGMIAFPLDTIDEMVELPTNRIKAEGKRRYILWHDRFIPFVPLAELLVYQRPSLANSQDFMKEKEVATVILRSGDSYVAVGVDAFIEEQEIVIKQLKGPVDKPQGLAGVTVLGNGQVMSIADVGELIAMVFGQLPAVKEIKPFHPTKVIHSPSQPTVLIVDDSITVRELLSMTFIKAGYRVEQAKDGQEATEKLKAGLACDMVFCDVEMPRMDGFEFLSQIQKDSRLNHIPVAMLTSRSADKHRQTAYQLGAKAYFTKPYLEEDLLRGAELLLKGGQMAMV